MSACWTMATCVTQSIYSDLVAWSWKNKYTKPKFLTHLLIEVWTNLSLIRLGNILFSHFIGGKNRTDLPPGVTISFEDLASEAFYSTHIVLKIVQSVTLDIHDHSITIFLKKSITSTLLVTQNNYLRYNHVRESSGNPFPFCNTKVQKVCLKIYQWSLSYW